MTAQEDKSVMALTLVFSAPPENLKDSVALTKFAVDNLELHLALKENVVLQPNAH
jgi:hypothetical protein